MLDNCHLSAEALIDRAHLESDNAATDNDHSLRNLWERKSASRSDHVSLINIEHASGEMSRLTSSRNNDVLCRDCLSLTVIHINGDFIRAAKLTPAFEVVDVIFLEEEFNTRRQSGHGFIFRVHQLTEVHRHFTAVDADLLEVLAGFDIFVSRVQQGFRRDATNVQASTAEAATLLDADCLESLLTRLNCGHIAFHCCQSRNTYLQVRHQ